MIGAAFLMCALLHLLCDTTWLDAWFCCAKALVLAEFAASLHWQLYVWWTLTYGKLSPAFAVVTMTVLYTGIYVGYYFLVTRTFSDRRTTSDQWEGTSQRRSDCSWCICHQ